MRATAGFLKGFFLLSGSFDGALHLVRLLQPDEPAGRVGTLIALGFDLAYLYVGAHMRRLLRRAPGRILGLLFVSAAGSALSLFLSLIAGTPRETVLKAILGLLITSYLVVSVRRLAAEAHASGAEAVTR